MQGETRLWVVLFSPAVLVRLLASSFCKSMSSIARFLFLAAEWHCGDAGNTEDVECVGSERETGGLWLVMKSALFQAQSRCPPVLVLLLCCYSVCKENNKDLVMKISFLLCDSIFV